MRKEGVLKMNYKAESWSERYYGKRRELKDELTRVIECETLMDVLCVTVDPPGDREEVECLIYGKISVKVGDSDWVRLLLKDKSTNFLTLPDLPDGRSPKPFNAKDEPDRNRIQLQMSLWERKKSEEEDVEIAAVTCLEHDTVMLTLPYFFEYTGPSHFLFGVDYIATKGSAVKIEVKIKEKQKINAEIEAIQNLHWCDVCACGQAVRTLYKKQEQVTAGDTLQLDRNVVLLPMHYEQFLTILIRNADQGKCNFVDFPFVWDNGNGTFRTNQQGIHTKDVPGTPFSVSIKFLCCT